MVKLSSCEELSLKDVEVLDSNGGIVCWTEAFVLIRGMRLVL